MVISLLARLDCELAIHLIYEAPIQQLIGPCYVANAGQPQLFHEPVLIHPVGAFDPQVRSRFDRSGIRYVNNLHGGTGFGKLWTETYCTKDRKEVERRLEADGHAFEWKPNGTLRICMHAPATLRHPATQEEVWTNQAEQWHSSSLESTLLEDLLSILGEEELPHNAFLGDGSPLSKSDLENIRTAMAAEERVFKWQAGDVLLCDNLLVMHGRQPYSGDRKILVSMG